MIVVLSPLHASLGDGPGDNIPTAVRPIPPAGIELDDSVRARLADHASQIRAAVEQAKAATPADQAEVLVFARAIELGLEQSTFYSPAEIKQAEVLTELALRRAKTLVGGDASPIGGRPAQAPNWLQAELAPAVAPKTSDLATAESPSSPRLIVGGFRSQIDGSIQPYGLVVPASCTAADAKPLRLDVWLHGRGEKSGEVQFLHQRSKQVGEVAPPDTIVLHPYGRYCNAFKFAGEIDVLEAIEHVKSLFPIDEGRINIRGFSMGGAGCWQMAVHYPGMWMAATPGAGFCETREFLKTFQQEEFVPTKDQAALLHWYDCPDWGNNLRYLPTIAYSGELDKQKQAADLMERTLQSRGIDLVHLIGPGTAHKLHPDSKADIERRLSELAANKPKHGPRQVDFTTYTLRYPQSHWVHVEGLHEHWKESRVQADVDPSGVLRVTTGNVTRLSLGPFTNLAADKPSSLLIDEQRLPLPASLEADQRITLTQADGRWSILPANSPVDAELQKRPGLQGPIDDAFLSPFVFVSADEVPSPSVVDRWVASEFSHATGEWRRQFRGDVHAKSAAAVSAEDKRSKNLILFGTPDSNPLIAEVLKTMPIAWTKTGLKAEGAEHPADTAALVAIYPSPYAKDRYVVINSGFTYREYAYLNNARQIAMLPDWAILDVKDGANSQMPGRVLEADFFDESWGLKTPRPGATRHLPAQGASE
ncbi:MAG: prolyl oligopeptidase family serine peptidase [Planctomycetaceae bacterium]